MTQAAYQRDLREIFRAYWNGTFNQAQFYDAMFSAIDIWLEKAWQEGAKQVGILPDEITPAEQVQLAAIVFKEYAHVPDVATFIERNKRGSGLLRTVLNRVALWGNRYRDVMNKAKVAAEKDPKLKWSLGPTKTHCSTCSKLHNKVKRASWWRDNVMPQNPPNDALECKGWKCGCSLEPTDEPLSRGRMPNLP